jgi:molecular chaperone GrpE
MPNENDANDTISDEPLETSLPPHASIEEMLAKLNEADAKANEYLDMATRVKAEFENYKKRAEKAIDETYKYAVERYAREFLEVADSIDNGIAAAQSENINVKTLQQGLELTAKIVQNIIHKLNLKVINPEGETFNPSLHEAMMIEETAEHAENTVLRVLQKGYQMHDRVIRPARVTVSKAK